MIILQRCLKSLRHYWKRTLLVFMVYSVLISILLIVAVLNITSATQLKDTQLGIGNSVYVRKVRLDDPNDRNSLSMFKEEESDKLTSDSRVESYNIMVMQGGNLKEGKPYIADKKMYTDFLERAPESAQRRDNAQFIGVTDSRFSVFFSGVGFRLTDGSGITQADEGKKVVMVSKKVADINGWKVGDKIQLATTKGYGVSDGEEFKAKIKGIYECPKETFVQDTIEYTPDSLLENYIFIPQTTVAAMDEINYQTNMIFVYLKDSDMIEDYVTDMKGKLGDVVDDITQSGWKAQFRYSWNSEWNQIISAPFQEINNVTRAAMWIILAGTIAVILLISSGELREKRKELGVWMACGERRFRILIQMLLEKMIPVVAAVIVALFIGLITAKPISSAVVGDTSEQFNKQIQEQRGDTIFWEELYFLNVELNSGNYDYFYVNNSVDLYRSRGAIAASVCGGLGLLGGILAFQIWAAMREKPRELIGDLQ